MARVRNEFVCGSCGFRTPRWFGRCPGCGEWNTMVEERPLSVDTTGGRRSVGRETDPQPITEIEPAGSRRFSSGIEEFDRVLGGGIVPGCVVLIGGDPGIGKSTLVLQALAHPSREGKTLYVSGEESPEQVKMRAERLGTLDPHLLVLAETAVETILAQAERVGPRVLVVDSIQTVYTEDLASAPGSIAQVRESASRIVRFAKSRGLSCFLVGHVTKEGSLAGPRVLEHVVDTVLYFEGDRGHAFRILRAVKNRFGSTNEMGVFEMHEDGLQPVSNPSALFLAERPENVPGSVVVASIEGTRPILVELQALVSPSVLATPRRTTLGLDHNRVALLIAVLEKKMGLHLAGHDVFVNIAGGVRLDEPATDLGAVAAVASSFLDRPIDSRTLVVGEVGLAGEVRAVGQIESRVREGAKLGFRRCVLPETSLRQVAVSEEIELCGVRSLQDAWDVLF